MKQVISHYQAVLPPSVDLTKPYKQIPGHYQAVQRTTSSVFDVEQTTDVECLMSLFFDNKSGQRYSDEDIATFNRSWKFFVADLDELEDTPNDVVIGTIKFSREASLFPTMNAGDMGCIISLLGREYTICYNAEGEFTIGHNGVLYCFSNSESWVDDINEFYWFVIENIIPDNGETVNEQAALN